MPILPGYLADAAGHCRRFYHTMSILRVFYLHSMEIKEFHVQMIGDAFFSVKGFSLCLFIWAGLKDKGKYFLWFLVSL
jgi:hypothetical protein